MIVLIFMIIIMGITVSVTATLVHQGPAVYQAERGTQTIYAAQSGLQVALGQIRSAAGATYGNPALLPCSVNGELDAASRRRATTSRSATTAWAIRPIRPKPGARRTR